MTDAPEIDHEVVQWLREHTMPLTRMTPEGDLEDLRPLEKILSSVQVLGVGESTHGTREFFQIRHRLLRHLVLHMNFNVLALEASYSQTQPLNEYVLHGRGDRASLVTGLRSIMWDVEEFAEALDWLQRHNQSVPEARRVRVLGADILHTKASCDRVLAYLQIVAAERVDATAALFRRIGAGEARGLLLAHEELSVACLQQLRALRDWLEKDKASLIARTSTHEHTEAADHLRHIAQWVSANVSEVSGRTGLDNIVRSQCLADNVLHMLQGRDGSQAKVIVWAHNYHIMVGFRDASLGPRLNMGECIKKKLGAGYYALGLELNRGTYLGREWLADKSFGDLTVGTITPPSEGSLPWHLSQTGKSSLLLNLRDTPCTPAVTRWLSTPQTMYCLGWARSDPPLVTQVTLGDACDGLIYIENTSASTPTKGAVNAVARGDGY